MNPLSMLDVSANAQVPPTRRDRLADLFPPLTAGVLIIACVLVSLRKHFWHDEVFTWTLVTDPSLWHMLRTIADGGEAAPPVYHLLARGWLAIVGAGELRLRLFTSLGFAVAIIAVWRLMRARYAPSAVAVAVCGVAGLSRLILVQNAEARFYGTFTALAALALLSTASLANTTRPRARHAAWNALAHGALAMCHIFGLVYSGAILGGLLLRDAVRLVHGRNTHLRRDGDGRSGRVRRLVLVYGSFLAGWSAFLFWIPAFLRQADLGKPHTWLPIPTIRDLKRAYTFDIVGWRAILVVVAVLVLWYALVRASRRTMPRAASMRLATGSLADVLPWAAACMLLVPIAAYVVSHQAVSIFFNRYFLPSSLAVMILASLALTLALRSAELPRRDGERWIEILWRVLFRRIWASAWPAVCIAALVHALVWAGTRPRFDTPGTGLRAAAGPAAQAVMVESPLEYLPAVHYAGAPGRPFFFVLDWESALADGAARQSTVDYKLMARWRDAGYLAGGIIESDSALSQLDRFLVVDEPGRLWFDRRIVGNPAFSARLVSTMQDSATGWIRPKNLWLVVRTVPDVR